jgi:hypothetical protein
MRTVETNHFFYPAYTNMLSRLDALEITNEPETVWMMIAPGLDLRRLP